MIIANFARFGRASKCGLRASSHSIVNCSRAIRIAAYRSCQFGSAEPAAAVNGMADEVLFALAAEEPVLNPVIVRP
jgi:hypothetical protein